MIKSPDIVLKLAPNSEYTPTLTWSSSLSGRDGFWCVSLSTKAKAEWKRKDGTWPLIHLLNHSIRNWTEGDYPRYSNNKRTWCLTYLYCFSALLSDNLFKFTTYWQCSYLNVFCPKIQALKAAVRKAWHGVVLAPLSHSVLLLESLLSSSLYELPVTQWVRNQAQMRGQMFLGPLLCDSAGSSPVRFAQPRTITPQPDLTIANIRHDYKKGTRSTKLCVCHAILLLPLFNKIIFLVLRIKGHRVFYDFTIFLFQCLPS